MGEVVLSTLVSPALTSSMLDQGTELALIPREEMSAVTQRTSTPSLQRGRS